MALAKGFPMGFPGWTQHGLSFPVQEPVGFEFQDSYAAANISGRRSVPQAGREVDNVSNHVEAIQ